MKRADWIAAAAILVTVLLAAAGWATHIDKAIARIETKLERFGETERSIQSVSERLARVEARHPGN